MVSIEQKHVHKPSESALGLVKRRGHVLTCAVPCLESLTATCQPYDPTPTRMLLMSNPITAESGTGPKKHVPFVPEGMQMKEFTLRAMLLGLLLPVVLGAATAYLGLRAGITIAATYPAAVIAMAVLRAWKGSLLEENIARTAGSVGESVAAGAIFTNPAFLLAGVWPSFWSFDSYWKSTALIMVGRLLGGLFISFVRRGHGGNLGVG